jgi:hypothetical protein
VESASGQQRGRPSGYGRGRGGLGGASPGTGTDGRPVVVGGYVMLLLLGVGQGLIGCFQYSRALGTVPAGALAFDALILVTCVLGAWGMRSPLGGLMPAVGWFVTSYVLAMGTSGGSVVITNTGAGKWYLYGGSVCAGAGVLIAFAWSSAARKPGR